MCPLHFILLLEEGGKQHLGIIANRDYSGKWSEQEVSQTRYNSVVTLASKGCLKVNSGSQHACLQHDTSRIPNPAT